MKRILLTVLFLCASYAQVNEKISYSPKFSGYIRTWYESDFSNSSFKIKHARIGVKGFLNNSTTYKILLDVGKTGKLSVTDEEGIVKKIDAKFSDILMDALIKVKLSKSVFVQAGQFKIPFSTSNLTSPVNVEFVNRPLITKITPALRDIGVQVNYDFKKSLPLEIQAGLFNGEGANNVSSDNKYNFVLRGVFTPFEKINLSINYYKGHIKNIETSVIDFGVKIPYKSIEIQGEYVNRIQKLSNKEDNSDAYFVNAIYKFPIDSEIIKNIRPAIRFDNFNPEYVNVQNKVKRMTLGLTLELSGEKLTEIKINYEKLLYDSKANAEHFYVMYQIKF